MIGCLLYVAFMAIAIAMCMEMKQFEYIPVSVETGEYIKIILITIVLLFVIGMRKNGMKKKISNVLASIILKIAKKAGNSASLYGLHQPKEPKLKV